MAVVRNQFFLCSLLIIVGLICVVASLTRYAQRYTLGESLLRAGMMEDADAMKALVAKGARVDLVDAIGYNVVFYAVQTGNIELVRLLLEKGADPNCGAPNALTPLGQAICLKDPDLVRLLLSYGADPLFNRGKYNNCLILARQTNDDRIMELLGVTEVDDSFPGNKQSKPGRGGSGVLEPYLQFEKEIEEGMRLDELQRKQRYELELDYLRTLELPNIPEVIDTPREEMPLP